MNDYKAETMSPNCATQDRIRNGADVANMPIVTKNEIVVDTVQSLRYRILYLPADNCGKGYWLPLDTATNIPKSFDLSLLREQLMIGTMEKSVDDSSVILDEELSEKGIARRDRAWGLISNIVTFEPDIYDNSSRAELLRSVETSSGVRMNNLYGYLGRYWRSGCQRNALAPDYRKCGGARVAQSLDKRVGRRKRPGENGKALNEKDHEWFRKAVSEFYQGSTGYSLRQTYNTMLAKYYIKPAEDDTSTPVTLSADEKPSFSQFYYWYHHHSDEVENTIKREGENKFALKYRAITGKTETELLGPGDSFQIDATIADFYLVRKTDRSLIVGRPVIVILKDSWSRMVTGLSVTLENSSCKVWKEALFNTGASKTDYCKRFGIEIKEEQWPCQCLPKSITTDNGEFAVKAVDEIVKTLGITVENCPPYRGDLKGIIERTFKTFQLTLKPFLPGYVDKDAGERGAKDYRRNSCLDLDTFTAILIKCVLFYNNHHYMHKYQRTEDMRKNNIPAIPAYLWNYGISHVSGTFKRVPMDSCIEVLLQKADATVTGEGIRLNGLYYICEEAIEQKWFERARVSGTYTIPVRYSSQSCDTIYYKKKDGTYASCALAQAYQKYKNYSQEALEQAHEDDLNMAASYRQNEDQAFSELVSYIESNVERCKSEGESGSAIIKALNRHSIDENRKAEQEELSGMTKAKGEQTALGLNMSNNVETSTASGADPAVGAKPKSFDTVSDEIDRLLADVGATSWSDFSNNGRPESE